MILRSHIRQRKSFLHTHLGLFIFSLILAFIFSLLPLPRVINYMRPNWLLLFVIAWSILAPHYMRLSLIWFLGLVQDVLFNSPLGEHALIFTLFGYILLRFQTLINCFSFVQRMAIVFGLLIIAYIIEFCLQSILGAPITVGFYWLSVLTSAICWPLIEVFLRYWQGRGQGIHA